MRLWPIAILDQLPRQQLLGQHRECCALRGKGWGRKHSTVDYVFKHPYWFLFNYHVEVMREMTRRGYHHNEDWDFRNYRGNELCFDLEIDYTLVDESYNPYTIYSEHDSVYLDECIANLAAKGVKIDRAQAYMKTGGGPVMPLYHVTGKKNVEVILREGLRRCHGDSTSAFISLSEAPDSWMQDGLALLSVNIGGLGCKVTKWGKETDEVCIWGDIPPERIKLVK